MRNHSHLTCILIHNLTVQLKHAQVIQFFSICVGATGRASGCATCLREFHTGISVCYFSSFEAFRFHRGRNPMISIPKYLHRNHGGDTPFQRTSRQGKLQALDFFMAKLNLHLVFLSGPHVTLKIAFRNGETTE